MGAFMSAESGKFGGENRSPRHWRRKKFELTMKNVLTFPLLSAKR
jgi:hypothetical protein